MLDKGQAQTGHLSCERCFGITLHLGTACTQLAKNGRNVHLRPQRWLWPRSCSPLEQPEYRSYETPEAQRFLMLSLKYSSSFTVQQLTNHARCLYELKALQKYGEKANIQNSAFLNWDFLLTSFSWMKSPLLWGNHAWGVMRNLIFFTLVSYFHPFFQIVDVWSVIFKSPL